MTTDKPGELASEQEWSSMKQAQDTQRSTTPVDTQMSEQERLSLEEMEVDASQLEAEGLDDRSVLSKVVKYFVRLATSAAAGWGCASQGISVCGGNGWCLFRGFKRH